MEEKRVFPFIATATFNLEGFVKRELLSLGFADAKAEQGGVRFSGTLEDAFRAALRLACADRVLLLMAEGVCTSFEDLYQLAFRAPWQHLIPRDGAVPVTGHCARSRLMSVRDCQSIVKKAVADKLSAQYRLVRLPENGGRYKVDVSLHRDLARLTVDLCGDALNRRGYRTWNGEAPLRETLAAAMVRFSGWDCGLPLVDPTCGTGTLLVEAAFLQSGRAPGLTRPFDVEKWQKADAKTLSRIRAEAKAAFDPEKIRGISGSDISEEALRLARQHIRQAGLENRVTVSNRDLRAVTLPSPAVFLSNPPYGERMSDRASCEKLYREYRPLLLRNPGSALTVITNHSGFERVASLRADRRIRLYNGRLECELLHFPPISSKE